MAKVASSSKVTKVSLVAGLVAIAMVFGLQMGQAQAQSSCVTELTNLNVCAPFVVPGNNANPNSACCGALQAVDHDCFCNTMRIISRLPSECNLPPITIPGIEARRERWGKTMPSQSMKETANLCLHTCLPNPFLSQQESENPASNLISSVAESRRSFASTTAASFFPGTQFSSPDSLPSLEDAFAQFVELYPDYSNSYQIDEMRAQEYYHLSLTNHVCLDYIGIGLFAFSQFHNQLCIASTSSLITQVPSKVSNCPLFSLSYRSVDLKSELLNSTHESKLESAIKERIKGFLNLDTDDYSVVFTSNRTAAFKLLAESYPYQSNKKLLTVYDHQSEAVDAMVSSSRKRGAKSMAAEFTWPRLRIQSTKLKSMLISKSKKRKQGLFVFQPQSRVTGARYSYQWMQVAQENGWHVLLDACALGPKDMDSFGLSLLQPDFLICSFYKVFGENPTGFGCLFVKKAAISLLEDSAIVGIASIVPANRFHQTPDPPAESDTQEDPTTNSNQQGAAQQDPAIRSISSNTWSAQENEFPANEIAESDPWNDTSKHQNHTKPTKNSQSEIEFRCLDHVDSLGLTLINSRGRYLINWLVTALLKLHHPNSESDAPLVRIYGPKIRFDRGPALAFNVFDWKGGKVDPILVQKLGDRKGISLSHGFLHNIRFPDKYQGEKGRVLEKTERETGVKVVTAALGYMADFRDVYRVWSFVAQFMDADFVEKERWRYTALNQSSEYC